MAAEGPFGPSACVSFAVVASAPPSSRPANVTSSIPCGEPPKQAGAPNAIQDLSVLRGYVKQVENRTSRNRFSMGLELVSSSSPMLCEPVRLLLKS
jgi:hypothetical protein